VRTLVTGAAGFIGSAYVRILLESRPDDEVVVLDKLTYAGRRENLRDVEGRIEFIEGAIEDPAAVQRAMQGCELVVNFAAETHVDRSISGPDPFAVTHVLGTGVLLDATRELGVARYIQVSTDEVYGSIARGSFTEDSPLRPSSPYSATKAAGDLLVQAHVHTHGIHAVICRGSNSYGPRQHPEKLIPLCALNALHGDALPVYGDGRQVRNWLYVDDFARAIDLVAREGAAGEVYNAGGPDEEENVRVVERILELTGADSSLIEHVEDRKGHDRRYSLSSDKMKAVGWVPQVAFEDGLERTVAWYRENEWWWQPIRSGEYREYYERQYAARLASS
jgi:dTDP-glucose 4,6-dehydratase